MSCSNCKSKSTPCGCTDTSLTTPPPCTTGTTACPNPDECPETFSAACTVWTGNDLICNSTVIATEGMRLDAVIENMVALFCGPQTPPIQDINLTFPLPDGSIVGLDDRSFCVDRINCFDDLDVSIEAGAPLITFTWEEVDGTPHIGDTTMVMESERSCLLFNIVVDQSVTPGNYTFNLIITGCGTTVDVPVFLVVT